MSDQKELINQVLKGNPKAQKQLYDSHAATMLGVCYRYCKSLAEAEDLLQEGFVKVFKNLKQFKGSGDLGAWVRRIMVNTAINEIKKTKIQLINREEEIETENLSTTEDPEILLTARRLHQSYS
jgi:RNA polymerase sigma-70 factor (ECF subfamily)